MGIGLQRQLKVQFKYIYIANNFNIILVYSAGAMRIKQNEYQGQQVHSRAVSVLYARPLFFHGLDAGYTCCSMSKDIPWLGM